MQAGLRSSLRSFRNPELLEKDSLPSAARTLCIGPLNTLGALDTLHTFGTLDLLLLFRTFRFLRTLTPVLSAHSASLVGLFQTVAALDVASCIGLYLAHRFLAVCGGL